MKINRSTVRNIARKAKDPLRSIARAASKACSKKNVKYAASLTSKAIRKITRK